MDRTRLKTFAQGIDEAWSQAKTVPAPSTVEPLLSVSDAYAIQEMIINARVESGRHRAGWKMGLTTGGPSTTPIVGTLLDDMVVASGVELSLATLVAPMVEAEVVVRIGSAINRPMTAIELVKGPHQIGAGIEVIDYRTIASSGSVDWIADNSTVAYAVIGAMVPVAETNPAEIEVALTCGRTKLATGRGDQVMGNPLEAVAWLAGHQIDRGRPLQPDDVILTGSLTGHHRVPGPDVAFEADFGDLGLVVVKFKE